MVKKYYFCCKENISQTQVPIFRRVFCDVTFRQVRSLTNVGKVTVCIVIKVDRAVHDITRLRRALACRLRTRQCGSMVISQHAAFIRNVSEKRQKLFVFTHHFVPLICTPSLSFMCQIKAHDLLFQTVYLVNYSNQYQLEQNLD